MRRLGLGEGSALVGCCLDSCKLVCVPDSDQKESAALMAQAGSAYAGCLCRAQHARGAQSCLLCSALTCFKPVTAMQTACEANAYRQQSTRQVSCIALMRCTAAAAAAAADAALLPLLHHCVRQQELSPPWSDLALMGWTTTARLRAAATPGVPHSALTVPSEHQRAWAASNHPG